MVQSQVTRGRPDSRLCTEQPRSSLAGILAVHDRIGARSRHRAAGLTDLLPRAPCGKPALPHSGVGDSCRTLPSLNPPVVPGPHLAAYRAAGADRWSAHPGFAGNTVTIGCPGGIGCPGVSHEGGTKIAKIAHAHRLPSSLSSCHLRIAGSSLKFRTALTVRCRGFSNNRTRVVRGECTNRSRVSARVVAMAHASTGAAFSKMAVLPFSWGRRVPGAAALVRRNTRK